MQLDLTEDKPLALRYALDADISQLRVPSATAPARTDGLWRHTCFEAFLAAGDSPAYYEVNLAPSSQWAVYRFDSYRQGMASIPIARAPLIAPTVSSQGLELAAVVSFTDLPELRVGAPLRVALAAVIETREGSLSYWALRHPAGKPDFHNAEGFVRARK